MSTSSATGETAIVEHPDWRWRSTDEAAWRVEEDGSTWHNFSEFWRSWPQREPLPNVLPLHMDPSPFTFGDTIFVPRSYPSLFDRILATDDQDLRRQALLTGQPGVGKSTWLWYALIRLLSQREDAVVLCWDGTIYLFYLGKVYSRDSPYIVKNLPVHVLSRPIIELVDVDNSTLPEGWMGSQVLPILTYSPNPARFKKFLSQKKPAVYGMNLWDLDELVQGFRLQKRSGLFIQKLGTAIAGRPTRNREVKTACELIRQWKEANTEEGADDNGDTADTVDRNLTILLDAVTAEFGFAPRDVYYAIFYTADARDEYTTAARGLDYADLRKVANNFATDYALPPIASHKVIAVSPRAIEGRNDKWTTAFKSPVIAGLISQRMQDEEENFIREQCNRMRQVPETSVLAGFFLETLSHREACHGRLPHLIPMACADTESNSLRFSFSPPTIATEAPLERARATPRKVSYVDFADLSDRSGVAADRQLSVEDDERGVRPTKKAKAAPKPALCGPRASTSRVKRKAPKKKR